MHKFLLSMAVLLLSLLGHAQGITSVGANIPILKSSRWSQEAYTAKVLVANSAIDYGEWTDQNVYYNMLVLEDGPALDANGKAWYEKDYDELTLTEDEYGVTEDGFFRWETQKAPFHSNAEYKGMPSFQWTANSIIADIYIRRTFTTDNMLAGDVYLACGHDDAPCEYYINGVLVWQATGMDIAYYDYIYEKDDDGNNIGDPIDSIPHYKQGWNDDEIYKLTEEQKDLIRIGGEENILAVHVHQNWGGAFADCGLYTMVEGGLDMGYVKPWDGKVIYNSYGGYNYKTNNDPHPLHNWEKLYEAQEGDVYTIPMEGCSEQDAWGSQMHFKTPITLENDKTYNVKFKLNATGDYSAVRVKICDNDNDEEEATAYESYLEIEAGEETEFDEEINGLETIKNLKLVFDFGGGAGNDTIKISDMSIKDEDDNELWIGTHYFNYFYMTKPVYDKETGEPTYDDETGKLIVEEIKWPGVEGRVETLAWTLPDFDDEQWDTWAMPCGNSGYMSEVKTVWPGGDNTNLWVRRNFVLDKVNPRLSYALNVCHDDNYETYVNGHLLQQNTGWTNGKKPVQVHIPAKFLNVGNNVIATYIQQNWGGKFYDCGINVEEVNYQECADELRAVIAKGEAAHDPLTAKMEENLAALVADGKYELATNMDAAEVKDYAKNMDAKVSTILGYASDVKVFSQTLAYCEKEDKGFLTEAIANAKENIDTCATADQVNVILSSLRTYRKKNAAERHTEKYVGSVPEADGEYYFYNVKDKRFLGGAESWGTHLATEYVSNAFALVAEDREGNALPKGFRIKTFRSNGSTDEGYTKDFMNYGGYVDTDTNDAWDFIPVEGKKNVYNIVRASYEYTEDVLDDNGEVIDVVTKKTNVREDGSLYYLGLRDGGENNLNVGFNSWNVVDTDMKDPANEGNQWMLITFDEMNELLATATEKNPVDATHLIVNPGYDQRLSIAEWFNGSSGGGSGVWGRGGNYVDFVWENWNTQYAEVSQVIYDLPEGWYELDVQGYYRDGHYTTHMLKVALGLQTERRASVFAYSGDGFVEDALDLQKSTICSFSDGINAVPGLGRCFTDNVTWTTYDESDEEVKYTCKGDGTMYCTDACWSAAEEFFQNGLWWNRLIIKVPAEGIITIGAMKEDAEEGDWLVVDNWRLKYLGNSNPQDVIDGIENVNVNDNANAREIYNLSGQRLSKTQKGVNIVNGKKYVVK
ncbi:MAG: hypothetical protein K5672_02180 [Bacteroidaceae bacterium]|nr:hypothetical protein [Bacteroidaceae bacterium]